MRSIKKKFIYITNSNQNNISLVYQVAKIANIECFSIWLYPESKKKFKKYFRGYCTKEDYIEPVTQYAKKKKMIKNLLIFFKKEALLKVINKKSLILNLDSITFYNQSSTQWVVSYIPHEKIIIVKYSKKIKNKLEKTSIDFTLSAPENF